MGCFRRDDGRDGSVRPVSILSFTGSRNGMTDSQKHESEQVLSEVKPESLVHGDCVGADCDIHQIAMNREVRVLIRPCTIVSMRANCRGGTLLSDPEPPLVRNRKIVQDGDMLLATPIQYQEITRSGTWSTIRFARRKNKPIIIIYPDGSRILEIPNKCPQEGRQGQEKDLWDLHG